jgi:FkbM family methyltransferase
MLGLPFHLHLSVGDLSRVYSSLAEVLEKNRKKTTMNNRHTPSLRESLIEIATNAPATLPPHGILGRPLFFLSPVSSLACHFIPLMLRPALNIVAAVGSGNHDEGPAGLEAPMWSRENFLEKAKTFPNALAVDFSASIEDLETCAVLCDQAGIERIDFVAALDELRIICIYQIPSVMRAVTLDRLDEYLRLADSLGDELSKETVYAMMLLRLTYDRRWLKSVMMGDESEYFSTATENSTFRLRDDEIFCDAGAYIGTTVARFVEATRGSYRAIHAFEPDRANFRQLQGLRDAGYHDLHLYNLALADREEVINFQEVGTMGSHLTRGGRGNSSIQAVRLDDKVEKISFLKMDIEGGEGLAVNGARRLLSECSPRTAITVYHYAHDLLEVPENILKINPDYRFRLRQHSCYYFDMVLYGEARSK